MGRFTDAERDEEIFKRSFVGLCRFGKFPNYFEYGDDVGSTYMRVGWDSKHLNRLIAISFPRIINMKPLYPEIRAWYESHDIEWKDYTRNGHRFMIGFVENDSDRIEALVNDAGKKIFKTRRMIVTSWSDDSIYYKSVLTRFLKTFYLAMAMIIFSFFIFLGYELIHIFKLTSPSITNVDRVELTLLVCLYGGGLLLKVLRIKPSLQTNFNWSRLKLRAVRISVLGLILLAAFSTA